MYFKYTWRWVAKEQSLCINTFGRKSRSKRWNGTISWRVAHQVQMKSNTHCLWRPKHSLLFSSAQKYLFKIWSKTISRFILGYEEKAQQVLFRFICIFCFEKNSDDEDEKKKVAVNKMKDTWWDDSGNEKTQRSKILAGTCMN